MNKFKFTTSTANNIARAVANVTDHGGQIRTLRETLATLYKGAPNAALGETETKMISDAVRAEYESRPTIAEKSVGPLVTNATKVAKWMPVILRVEGKDGAAVAASWASLCKFSTQLGKAEGNVRDALKAFKTQKAPDFTKSAATHFKALINMNDGRHFTAKQKAAIMEAATICGIKLV